MEFIHSITWNDTHIHWHNGKNERKWTEQFVLLIFKMYIHPHSFLNDTFSMEDILGIFLVSLCWGARSRFGRPVHWWPCLYVLRPIGTLIYLGTKCTHIFRGDVIHPRMSACRKIITTICNTYQFNHSLYMLMQYESNCYIN